MDTTFSIGLLGVSTQSIFVESVKAPSSASASLEVDRGDGHAPGAEDSREQSVGAAVGVVAQDDVVARGERTQQRVFAGEPRGEGDAVRRLLQVGEARLERRACGIVAARVVGESHDADRVLDVGRGEVDRGIDGTVSRQVRSQRALLAC